MIDSVFSLKNDYHFTLLNANGDMSYFLKKSGGIEDEYSYPRHFFHFDGALYLLACYNDRIYCLETTDSLPPKVMEIQPLLSKEGLELIICKYSTHAQKWLTLFLVILSDFMPISLVYFNGRDSIKSLSL